MIAQRLHDEATPILSAMIVDSDAAAIRRLKALIKDHPHIVVAGTAHTIAQAVEEADKQRPDVVFFDVSIADGQPLPLVRHTGHDPAVVVVTKRPDYAIAAFRFGAVDYLLKPISAAQLAETLQRLDRLFLHRRNQPAAAGTRSQMSRLSPTDRVPLSSSPSGRRTTDIVTVADVVWVESLQNYTIVQLPGHDRRQMKRTLTEWTELLPEPQFVRIGRSHLIQLAKLSAITTPSRNEWLAHFHDVDKPLRLGRAAASKLRGILRGSCPA
jgi:two-component system LytT family response regulator